MNFIIKLNKLSNNKQQQMRIMNFNAIFSCMNILSNNNKNRNRNRNNNITNNDITNNDITNNNLNNLKIIPSSL